MLASDILNAIYYIIHFVLSSAALIFRRNNDSDENVNYYYNY